jgi:NADH:ubiquinone oxidoreductase subunit 5 (subunit L)/multisubunit Na+/H+ antiporter MnhA subunit
MSVIWMLILIPAIVGAILLVTPIKTRYLRGVIASLTTAFLVYLIFMLWNREIPLINIPWAGFKMDFQLRYYPLSRFIVAAITGFTFLITLYSVTFMADKPKDNQFYGYTLLSEAMAIGAALANNLVVMLFFWEGLLITLFTLISSGNEKAYKTAVKAFIIVGLSDLCLTLGIGMVWAQAKTLVMSDIKLDTVGLNGVAFVLMMVGAMAKAGAIPFHTWIPDAANDAQLPFMALFPGALEKLLGIYLVFRIALDFFKMTAGMCILVMSIGAVTIILAVMMALIQKDFKRLLSYHAVSQVGYMILGIGTGVPVGIVGGLFHMINHALYKSCLFLTSGSVEKQNNTTDLRELGGLWRQQPITMICFLIAAASISGVPPFNGFVSKDMIFEGALHSGYRIFFVVAVLGALFTAASFLKVGHAVFFDKADPKKPKATEVHWTMQLPMMILALTCVVFGIWFKLPLESVLRPAVFESMDKVIHNVHFEFALNDLFWLTMLILTIAVINHWIGYKLTGKGSGASEHIHQAPVFHQVYDWAEQRVFDPYVQGKNVSRYAVQGLFLIDRGIDWFYQTLVPVTSSFITKLRHVHNGLYANYLSWSVGGLLIIILYLILTIPH